MKKTIYLIDDDVDDRIIYREIIDVLNPGILVIEATDGLDFLAQIKNQGLYKPSILIVDMRMPSMDGLEMLKSFFSLAEDRNDVFPVMITSLKDSKLKKIALQSGIYRFYEKPHSFQSLKDMFEELLFDYLDCNPKI